MSEPDLDLGSCCVCSRGSKRARVRNILMLSKRAPIAGTGWGCLQCGLPQDGAMAVVCERCVRLPDVFERLRFACLGNPASKGRIPVEDLDGEAFEHDMSKHPGEKP